MHFSRKKRDLNAITSEASSFRLGKDKRAGQNRMLHFGKRDNGLAESQNTAEMNRALRAIDELVKRAGQNRMLHFGKRSSDLFMHFGKQYPSNRFMHFGKRPYDLDTVNPSEKHVNRFMHFGKREGKEIDAIVDGSSSLEDELNKRSILSDADMAEIGAEIGIVPEEVRPQAQKRFSITYPSPIFQQALMRHRLGLLGKEHLRDQDGRLNGISGPLGNTEALNQQQTTASLVGSEDLLDRMGRSEQFQIPQPKAQSRWTRPDRNVFLHFG
ncbi:FMRFamide-related peptides-like [Tropilaelaps mercedesae]|uniref:FMRFamide-related peptides-like n=1 Tax=Tropilaelaps mercedesae TaxID=418985 RepID=A0A1V9X6E8_9ACAR|nr:FMRFamide-related peptides-like [Tropilaelaps mercedesae]